MDSYFTATASYPGYYGAVDPYSTAYVAAPAAPVVAAQAALTVQAAQEYAAYNKAVADYNKWHQDYTKWYNATYGTNAPQGAAPPPPPPNQPQGSSAPPLPPAPPAQPAPPPAPTAPSSSTSYGNFSGANVGKISWSSTPASTSKSSAFSQSYDPYSTKSQNYYTTTPNSDYTSTSAYSGTSRFAGKYGGTSSYMSGRDYGQSSDRASVSSGMYGQQMDQSGYQTTPAYQTGSTNSGFGKTAVYSNRYSSHYGEDYQSSPTIDKTPAYADVLSHYAQHGMRSQPPPPKRAFEAAPQTQAAPILYQKPKPKVKKPKRKKTQEERKLKKTLRLRRTIQLPGMNDESETETETESEDEVKAKPKTKNKNQLPQPPKKPVQVVPPQILPQKNTFAEWGSALDPHDLREAKADQPETQLKFCAPDMSLKPRAPEVSDPANLYPSLRARIADGGGGGVGEWGEWGETIPEEQQAYKNMIHSGHMQVDRQNYPITMEPQPVAAPEPPRVIRLPVGAAMAPRSMAATLGQMLNPGAEIVYEGKEAEPMETEEKKERRRKRKKQKQERKEEKDEEEEGADANPGRNLLGVAALMANLSAHAEPEKRETEKREPEKYMKPQSLMDMKFDGPPLRGTRVPPPLMGMRGGPPPPFPGMPGPPPFMRERPPLPGSEKERPWGGDERGPGEKRWGGGEQGPGDQRWGGGEQGPGDQRWGGGERGPGDKRWGVDERGPGDQRWGVDERGPGEKRWDEEEQKWEAKDKTWGSAAPPAVKSEWEPASTETENKPATKTGWTPVGPPPTRTPLAEPPRGDDIRSRLMERAGQAPTRPELPGAGREFSNPYRDGPPISKPVSENRFTRALKGGTQPENTGNRFSALFQKGGSSFSKPSEPLNYPSPTGPPPIPLVPPYMGVPKPKLADIPPLMPRKPTAGYIPGGVERDENFGGRIKSDLLHEIATSDAPTMTASKILQDLSRRVDLNQRWDVTREIGRKVKERTEELRRLSHIAQYGCEPWDEPEDDRSRTGYIGKRPVHHGPPGNDDSKNGDPTNLDSKKGRAPKQNFDPKKEKNQRKFVETEFSLPVEFGKNYDKLSQPVVRAASIPTAKRTNQKPPETAEEAKRQKNDVELSSANKESKKACFNIQRTLPPGLFEMLQKESKQEESKGSEPKPAPQTPKVSKWGAKVSLPEEPKLVTPQPKAKPPKLPGTTPIPGPSKNITAVRESMTNAAMEALRKIPTNVIHAQAGYSRFTRGGGNQN